MRLLRSSEDGRFELISFYGSDPPPYAIYSHMWTEDEVRLRDIQEGTATNRRSYHKLLLCKYLAERDGLQYFHIDTCCIDPTSSAELSEAINSTFKWFRDAHKCYVHLIDVSRASDLRKSRWFTRCWTLQELLAPPIVEFYSHDGTLLGDKISLVHHLHDITGIPINALKGSPLSDFGIEERISWGSRRVATRGEDKAYSLLGILEVHMPLLYGEGEERAFRRLRREVAESQRYEQVTPEPKDNSTPRQTVHHLDRQSPTVFTPEVDAVDSTSLSDLEMHEQESALVDQEPQDLSCYLHSLGDDDIRILTLDPGKMGSTITGRIQKSNLLKPPPYNALSYCWGQEPAIQRVLINNEITLIKPNLYYALQRIRALQTDPIRMWVDSVCINQRNDSERNAQVRRMARIYNGADAVFIWLGEEDATSKLALNFVANVYKNKFTWHSQWWKDYGFEALSRLLERSWFQRGWVLQEAAFSTNSIIQCGDSQVYMDHFGTAMDSIRARISAVPLALVHSNNTLHASPLAKLLDSPAFKMLDLIDGAFTRSADGVITDHRISLETLVHLATFCETSDERDSIYALLNMANDSGSETQTNENHIILPDYGKAVLDVYADFIMHCCQQSDSLDILCRPWAPPPSNSAQSTWRKDRSENSKVPSWIRTRDSMPYGNPTSRSRIRLHGNPLVGGSQKRLYTAHYKTQPTLSVGRNWNSSVCDGSLTVKGITIAKISRRSTRMANAIVTKESLELLGSIMRRSQSGNIILPEEIWRTLCADRDERGDPATASFRVAMLDVLQRSLEDPEALRADDVLKHMSSIDIEELLESDIPEHTRKFLVVVRDTVWNRRTFQSEPNALWPRRLVGLVPQHARVGDIITILYGCSVPVVLREVVTSVESWWEMVGEAYVHGIMNGEVFRQTPETTLKQMERDFMIE